MAIDMMLRILQTSFVPRLLDEDTDGPEGLVALSVFFIIIYLFNSLRDSLPTACNVDSFLWEEKFI